MNTIFMRIASLLATLALSLNVNAVDLNLDDEIDSYLDELEDFNQEINNFVDREGTLLGARIETLLQEANISVVDGNLLWEETLNTRLDTGRSCSFRAQLRNTVARATLYENGTDLKIAVERDLSKPIFVSVDLYGELEADGRIKLRYGAKIFGSCSTYASDSFGFDFSTGLVASLTLQINLNPELLSNNSTIRFRPEIFLTGDLMLEDFLLNVNTSEIDTFRFLSSAGTILTGSSIIGSLIFNELNDRLDDEIRDAPDTIISEFHDTLIDQEQSLQEDINAAVVSAGGTLYTGPKGARGFYKGAVRITKTTVETLSYIDVDIPSLNSSHVSQITNIINRPGFARFPISLEYVDENRGQIAYALLTGDDRFLVEQVFTTLACEESAELMTPLNYGGIPAPFTTFNRSYSTFCDEYINTNNLGNARDLYKASATERDGWSIPYASQFNIGVEDIAGNARPYMRRAEYKYIRESGLQVPFTSQRALEELFLFDYDYYGTPFDTNNIIGYEGNRYRYERRIKFYRPLTYGNYINDKELIEETNGELSGPGYEELLKLKDELKASIDEACIQYTGEDLKKCRQDQPATFFNSRYEYPFLRECSLEMRVYSKSPASTNQKPLIAIHGGSWKFRGFGFFGVESQISHYTDQGYVVFAPFYRLSGDSDGPSGCQNADWTEIVSDIEDALDWVLDNGEQYGANTYGPIPIIGQSAGAHLAAWLATERPADVSRALLLYPPLDFANAIELVNSGQYANPTGIASFEGFIGVQEDQTLSDVDTNSEVIRRNSIPEIIRNEGAENFPPFFILHGNADELVPSSQSVRLCNGIAGSFSSGPANDNGYPFRQVYECGPGSELHLFNEANHILDLCIPGVVCPAGSNSSQSLIRESMAQAREWLGEQNYAIVATENSVDSRHCNWSFRYDSYGMHAEYLYCRMGQDRVGSLIRYSPGNIAGVDYACDFELEHTSYDLTYLNRHLCDFEVVQLGVPRQTDDGTTSSPAAPEPVFSTLATNAPLHSSLPSSSSRSLASGCTWQQQYDTYGTVSYDLICSGTKFANLLRYYSGNITNTQYACRIETFESGTTGAGTYGQAGNICNFTIRGYR